jgi:hypothetical protein
VPGIGTVITALAVTQANTVYVGFFSIGTAGVAGVTSVTNAGTARTYPTVVFYGPAAGLTTIYQIENAMTGRAIFMNLTINPGEIVTLRTSSNGATLTSSFRGDVSSAILTGSTPDFALAPGANSIAVFSQTTIGSGNPALMRWANAYQSLADLTW